MQEVKFRANRQSSYKFSTLFTSGCAIEPIVIMYASDNLEDYSVSVVL